MSWNLKVVKVTHPSRLFDPIASIDSFASVEERLQLADAKLKVNRERFLQAKSDLNRTLEHLRNGKSFESSSFISDSKNLPSASSTPPKPILSYRNNAVDMKTPNSPIVMAHQQIVSNEKKIRVLEETLSKKSLALEKVRQTLSSTLQVAPETSESPVEPSPVGSSVDVSPAHLFRSRLNHDQIEMELSTLRVAHSNLQRDFQNLQYKHEVLLRDYHQLLEEKEEFLFHTELATRKSSLKRHETETIRSSSNAFRESKHIGLIDIDFERRRLQSLSTDLTLLR